MCYSRRIVAGCVVAGFAVVLCYSLLEAQGPRPQPQWIWLGDKPGAEQTVYFRQEVTLKGKFGDIKLYGTCDNEMTVYINGKEVIHSDSWETPVFKDVTDFFRGATKGDADGRNVIAVKARNHGDAAGLLLRITFQTRKGPSLTVVTDGQWRASEKAEKGWNEAAFDDRAWAKATVIAPLGGGPWASITEASLGGAAKFKQPTATPTSLIKIKKDFKVELLYSVPRETQGSWVSMCVDDKGRLITSDQYGKLYRITLPSVSGGAELKVDQLPVDLGEAQGLLWAFDSLYVVVNKGKKYESGLWRVTSSKKNDVLDTKEKLRDIQGSGEHGPHAVILSPDGKSLYVVAGNHTKLTKLSGSKVPLCWGEDFIVPRLWDASGHAVGILAPGGVIYKVDPSGRNWELVSVGYRNQYDIAFNRDGELFTYDSDMEWDMSLPWYKPTRVCHAVDGSELGWRSGTSNFPASYPDCLPNVVDVGPGSPTGMGFGYSAKFPMKYQEALYLCDWSYGKLYALHLKEDGSSYVGELEEFMNGSPLPLTDIVVNPKDGAMYFTIGGRNTMSGLYRVTYTGTESTAAPPKKGPPSANAKERGVRKKLESYYAKKDPAAIDVAWPHLSSPDRFLRYAARTVLEFQEPAVWQDKALKETDPIALIHAVLGLVRVGDKMLQPKILEALERVDWQKLDPSQKIDYLRTYQLAFIRMGEPDAAWKERVTKRVDSFYPAELRETNSELCKLLSYLESPSGITKTLALLTKAPSQEEQIDYALSLRTVKTGWTKMQREEYLNWFHKAMAFRGGHSFYGFLRNIRTDAIKSLSDSERMELKAAIDNVPQPAQPKFTFKERPFVKKYTVEELLPVVEGGLKNRNYDRGRNLFGETKCFVCHRYANEGGGMGPDLTILSGRFGPRDLLESIIEPSKVVSDQYQAIVITTTDGRQVTGRIINLQGDGITVNVDMLDPNKNVTVNRKLLDTIEPSKISMMPEGLIDALQRDEILDLMAYLLSRGDRNHAMFRKDQK